MRTIPSKKIIHATKRRNGDMQGINFRLFWQWYSLNQHFRKMFSLFRYVNFRDTIQLLYTFLGSNWVPGRSFLNDQT